MLPKIEIRALETNRLIQFYAVPRVNVVPEVTVLLLEAIQAHSRSSTTMVKGRPY